MTPLKYSPAPVGVGLANTLKPLFEASAAFEGSFVREQTIIQSARLVKEARLSAGLSQAQLASRLGVEQSTVARFESPHSARGPNIALMAAVLHECGFALSLNAIPKAVLQNDINDIPYFWNLHEKASAMLGEVGVSYLITDRQDRIALFNDLWLSLHRGMETEIRSGICFTDYLRLGVRQGMFPDAADNIDQWIDWRMEQHRNPGKPFDLKRQNEIWLRVVETRINDNMTITIASDATAKAKLKEICDVLAEGQLPI
jgi:transcriptional regulator with XRE-family HTH domain